MKRYGNLWSEVVAWPNLVLAAQKARRGKRNRASVQRFEFRREYELLRLQNELISHCWQPGPYVTHWVAEPKRRMISAAPYRDRVLHHAVMNVLEPILERHFHPHSFACRAGRGTHAASRHLQHMLRRYRYSVQFDIRKFFPSIDHERLKEQFRRLIKDHDLLNLMDRIVDGSNEQEPNHDWFPGDDLFTPVTRRKGLPIGNLTSQLFANWYLDPLDHWLTSHQRMSGYVRYCDDFLVLSDDRGKLQELMASIPLFLEKWRQQIHQERVCILPCSTGRVFVGYHTTPSRRRITATSKRRFLRRLRWMKRAFAHGRILAETIHQRLMSWIGHAGQADSLPLLRRLAADWLFKDGRFVRFLTPTTSASHPLACQSQPISK